MAVKIELTNYNQSTKIHKFESFMKMKTKVNQLL